MSRRDRIVTGLGAALLAGLGFVGGSVVSAYLARQARADDWRDLTVEHEGTHDQATRTRVVFAGPELPIQEVEVTRDSSQAPNGARVTLRDGTVLTLSYDGRRPIAVVGPDGARATLAYRGPRADVTFTDEGGATRGDATVVVPAALRAPLAVGRTSSPPSWRWAQLGEALIPAARAQDAAGPGGGGEEPPPTVTVQRELPVELETKAVAGDEKPEGEVLLEASCPPFTCVVRDPERPMPAKSTIGVVVAGTTERPSDVGDAASFESVARDERRTAQRLLDDAAGAVAAVGVVAKACRFAKVDASVCAPGLGREGEKTEGAIVSLDEHEVTSRPDIVDKRARALALDDAARAKLDRSTKVELCANRPGYVRACTTIEARPFGEAPMASVARTLVMQRGIGGTLIGDFDLRQRDGADCKFSPSPRIQGDLRLTFDPKAGTVTARFSGRESGSRRDLRCSLGTANMRWNQSYSGSATQTVGAATLRRGEPLELSLRGRMTGTGSFSFSNCRSGSGASAGCPAGRTESYNYGIRIVGRIDPSTQRGKGTIIVTGAPLSTSGTWVVPKAKEAAP